MSNINYKADPTFALACRRVAPMMQMKMIVTWLPNSEDDQYQVRLVYCINPKTGKVYTEHGSFDTESALFHNYEDFSSTNVGLADLEEEIRDGKMKSINRENLDACENHVKKMLGISKPVQEMKYTEIVRNTKLLSELNMSPSSLNKFVSANAGKFTAGFECECIFGGMAGDNYDGEPERDMDQNEDIYRNIDFDDIKHFFELGRSEIEKMQDEYQEFYWQKEQEWVDDNIAEVAQRMADEHNAAIDDPDDHEDAEYFEDDAREELQTDYSEGGDGPSLYEWLREELGLRDYEDIGNQFGFSWPHWTSGESGDGGYNIQNAEVIGEWLQVETGLPYRVNADYHGGREEGAFALEPDASITPDDSDDMGVEIVSPPLPLEQCMSALEQTLNVIKSNNGYTNESTGMHFNLSIADMELDYVKLVLFCGDAKVLADFDRLNNTYTAQMLNVLAKRMSSLVNGGNDPNYGNKIAADPSFVSKIISSMQSGALRAASEAIMTNNSGKFVSVNFHQNQNYVEFRSMGGDYVNKWPEIKQSITRFAQAMEVAANPQAYQKEYAKKLYKLVSSVQPKQQHTDPHVARGINDAIAAFAMVSSGEITPQILKQILKHRFGQREAQKPVPPTQEEV